MQLDRFLQTSLTVLSCLVYCIIIIISGIIIYDGSLQLQPLSLIYLFLCVSVVQCVSDIKIIIISEIILG